MAAPGSSRASMASSNRVEKSFSSRLGSSAKIHLAKSLLVDGPVQLAEVDLAQLQRGRRRRGCTRSRPSSVLHAPQDLFLAPLADEPVVLPRLVEADEGE